MDAVQARGGERDGRTEPPFVFPPPPTSFSAAHPFPPPPRPIIFSLRTPLCSVPFNTLDPSPATGLGLPNRRLPAKAELEADEFATCPLALGRGRRARLRATVGPRLDRGGEV